MQIVFKDNLHEMSKPISWEKMKKIWSICRLFNLPIEWLSLGFCVRCLFRITKGILYAEGHLSQILLYQLISVQRFWIDFRLNLTLLLLSMTCPVLANSVDPDQLASEEANWSGSALFVIKYVNFYQKPGSSNLIGWKLEVGVAS